MAVGANDPATVIGVITALLVMVWITLLIRIYVRVVIARSFGWDDFFVIVAALHVSLCGVATCVGTHYGLTQHIAGLSPDELRSFFISFYCVGAGYVGSAGYIKISLLLQYLRVFEKGSKPYRFGQGMVVFMSLWTFGFVFTNWFSCFPKPSNFWNERGKGCYGSFSNNILIRNRFIEAHSSLNTLQDFVILALGGYLFGVRDKDGLPLNRKGLSVVLGLGAVACAFSVWRLTDVVILFSGPGANDVTFNIAGVFLNSTVEVAISCLCATTPFFWPIIQTGLNMIFVKYEFNVSTESRWHDDQIELASTDGTTVHQHFVDKSKSDYPTKYNQDQGKPHEVEGDNQTNAAYNDVSKGRKAPKGQFELGV